MASMEQLIGIMTANIKGLVKEVVYVEDNYYVLILKTGEHIHFTKDKDEKISNNDTDYPVSSPSCTAEF